MSVLTFLRTTLLFLLLFHAGVTAQNWQQVPEIGSRYVNAVVEHGTELYAASDSTIYRSSDGGTTWQPTVQQPASFELHTLLSVGTFLYLGTRGDGVFRSPDGGQSWQEINTGLTGNAQSITEFAVRGDSLYASTNGDGIYVLNLLNPTAWSAFNDGLFQLGANSIIANGNTLVAGIGQYVFHRPHTATQWSYAVFDSQFNRTPLKLFQHGPNIFLGTTGGVYRGNSDGTLWERADITQFPNQDIVAFTANGPRLFAGLSYLAQHWIFSTDDLGGTWDVRAHEFADLLTLSVGQGKLWAGRTDGLWWLDLTAVGIKEAGVTDPKEFRLLQNYPNPFNPSTTITYIVASRTSVSLKVYNVLGGVVATLADGMKEAGSYEVNWDATGLPAGVYYYRLSTEQHTAVAKMLLMK